MTRLPLTRLAHRAAEAHLTPGALAVDATAGNGHDTLFLARAVGPAGRVWAFDVQPRALERTRRRLEEAGLENVWLLHAGHQRMEDLLPPEARGRIAAVFFNLGYLPGSDRSCTTRPETTCEALAQAARLLAPGGLLSVLAYRGHPGGMEESEAAAALLAGLEGFRLERHESPGPVLFLARRAG